MQYSSERAAEAACWDYSTFNRLHVVAKQKQPREQRIRILVSKELQLARTHASQNSTLHNHPSVLSNKMRCTLHVSRIYTF